MKAYKSLYIVLIFVVTAIIIFAVLKYRTGHYDFARLFSHSGKNVEFQTMDVNVDPFTNIDIEADAIYLEMVESDEYRVSFVYPEYVEPSVGVDDGCLKIKIKENGVHVSAIVDNKMKKDNRKLVIYAPASASLGKLEADIDAGDINLKNRVFENLDIKGDAANIKLDGVSAENAWFRADAGNVEVSNAKFGDLTVKTDAGNVQIDNFSAAKVEIETDMGNVELEKADFENAILNSSMGNIEVDGKFDSITSHCSLGRIAVDGENLDTAKLDLTVDLGDISVGGKNYKGKAYKN